MVLEPEEHPPTHRMHLCKAGQHGLSLIFAIFLDGAEAGALPEIFEPGISSSAAHEASPAFSPDDNTMYFSRQNSAAGFIVVSHRSAGHWSNPGLASFSGTWEDSELSTSPDGTILLFVSNRPLRSGGRPLDGRFQGQSHVGGGGNLWRVDRTPGGWSVPVLLPGIIKRSTTISSPAVASDGSLYFMDVANRPPGHFQLFRSALKDGVYQAPEALPFSDGTFQDADLAIAPDESFAVFSSSRPPADHSLDVFIAFHGKSGWGKLLYLGHEVNVPGTTSNCEA